MWGLFVENVHVWWKYVIKLEPLINVHYIVSKLLQCRRNPVKRTESTLDPLYQTYILKSCVYLNTNILAAENSFKGCVARRYSVSEAVNTGTLSYILWWFLLVPFPHVQFSIQVFSFLEPKTDWHFLMHAKIAMCTILCASYKLL